MSDEYKKYLEQKAAIWFPNSKLQSEKIIFLLDELQIFYLNEDEYSKRMEKEKADKSVLLNDLITIDERYLICRGFIEKDFFLTPVRNMTVAQLSSIALVLIQTERGDGPLPEMVLSAEAINILTKRAIEKNLPIP